MRGTAAEEYGGPLAEQLRADVAARPDLCAGGDVEDPRPSPGRRGRAGRDLADGDAVGAVRRGLERFAPYLFARVGAVLRTVSTAFGGADASGWCERALEARSDERRALGQLSQWTERIYADARALRHANRDGLKAALTRHETGDAFQKFRKLVKEKRLRDTAPVEVGAKIHRVLCLMSETRDVWKAVVRKEELPVPLQLN